eukprot:9001261-Heterocapsa_arctica.AAC.1
MMLVGTEVFACKDLELSDLRVANAAFQAQRSQALFEHHEHDGHLRRLPFERHEHAGHLRRLLDIRLPTLRRPRRTCVRGHSKWPGSLAA